MNLIKDLVTSSFQETYQTLPTYLTWSPGRVNLLGEHTDYNDGFVLPMTINHAVWTAIRPRSDRQVVVHSLDQKQSAEFSLDDLSRGSGGWQDYITGVAWSLQEAGFQITGWEGVLAGDVPIGAGLSSSAALELAIARAFAISSDLDWDPKKMAQFCQIAENEWIGIQSGIMDQLVSACGQEGSALMIDCRSLETKLISLPVRSEFIILDTGTRRGLVDSAYNDRRAQCEAAACHFDVKALRDVDLSSLEESAGQLNLDLYKRSRHVITANQRVLDGMQALEEIDSSRFGELMNESHASMRDDFEISREEMDWMVDFAQSQPGCYGARMTGGGFGGCAVALVKDLKVGKFIETVTREYKVETGLDPKIYPVKAVNGTSYLKL